MKKINIRKVFLMITDVVLVLLSSLVSNALLSLYGIIFHSNTEGISVNPARIFWVIALNVLFCFFLLFVFGVYNMVWKEMRKRDYLYTALATVIGLSVAGGFSIMTNHEETLQFYILNLFVTSGVLVLFRIAFRRTLIDLISIGEGSDGRERTLIVGAGQAAKLILAEIRNSAGDPNNPSNNILPVALVDDDISKLNTKLLGVSVVGTTKDIPSVCKQNRIGLIIFAIPSCDEEDRRRIMEICSKSDCKIKTVPYLSQLFLDDNSPNIMTQVKDIRIEDLLGRHLRQAQDTRFHRGQGMYGHGRRRLHRLRAGAPDRQIRPETDRHRRYI